MMEGIKKLLLKDWIFINSSLKKWVILSLVGSFFLPWGNVGTLFIVPIIIGYVFNYGILAYEEKYSMNAWISALPVEPSQICTAKYIAPILYAVISTLIMMISLSIKMLLFKSLQIDVLVQLILAVLAVSLIYNGIILPIILYFGALKSRMIIMGLYLASFILVSIAQEKNGEMLQQRMNEGLGTTGVGILAIIGVIIYAISYCLGRVIYRHKEFK